MPRRRKPVPTSDPFSAALKPMIAQLVDERLAQHLREWLSKHGASVPAEVPTEPEHVPTKASAGTKRNGSAVLTTE